MERKLPGDEAFEFYAALGPGRSYKAVAEEFGVSKTAVVNKATKDAWQDRLREREEKARVRADERAVESLEAVNRRHLAALRAIQGKALETLRSMSLNSAMEAVRSLDIAIKHERLVLGEPTDRPAISVEETIRKEYQRWMLNDDGPDGESVDDHGEEDGEA